MNATVKLWRWRRNPVRRRSDIAEALVGLAAGVVMVVGAPVAGIAAADSTAQSLAQQNDARHRVPAVLVHNAPSTAEARSEGVNPDQVRTVVRWTTPQGDVRTGSVAVSPGTKAGTSTPVWLDGRGALTEPPLSPGQTTLQTDIMGGGAAAGFCVLVLVGHRLVVLELDRRRSQEWQREWERVEPQWTRGHHA